MPQIPRYARQSLVSSYVGAPVHSHKEDLAAAFGQGMDKLSKVVGAQLDATAKQQAATALYKYQQNYTKTLVGTPEAQGLADQYADDPMSLPQEALRMGEKLAGEMTQGLNKRAQKEFTASVQGFLMSENKRLGGVALQQNRANQVVAMGDGLDIMSDTALNVADKAGIEQVVNGIHDTAFNVDGGAGAISPKARASLFAKSFTNAKKNFISSRLQTDPVQFAVELNEGAYETVDVNGEKVPFIGGDEARRYISAAKSIAKNREQQALFDFAVSNGEMAVGLVDQYNKGVLTFDAVSDLEFQAREMKQNDIANMYKSFNQIMISGNDRERVTDTNWLVGTAEEIMKLSKRNRFGRASISPQDKMSRGFQIIEEANEKFAKNELTRADHRRIIEGVTTGIVVPTAKSIRSQTPYFQGLEQVREHLDGAKTLSKMERDDLLAEAMAEYDDLVRQAGKPTDLTPDKAQVASKRVIEAIKAKVSPAFSSLEVGDMVPTATGMRKMIGRDGLGNPILEFTGEDVRKFNY